MAEAAKIVELKERAPRKTIDLRTDNRILALLDEYEDAVIVYLEAKRVRDELHAEIVAKMAGAEEAQVDGWRLTMPWFHRKEHFVRATQYQRLFTKRRHPRRSDDMPHGKMKTGDAQ